MFPHALSSLYCILIYTTTVSGCASTICLYLQILLPYFILQNQIYYVQTVTICQLLLLGHLLTSKFAWHTCHHYIHETEEFFKTCANITCQKVFSMLRHHQRNFLFFLFPQTIMCLSAFVSLLHPSFYSLMHNVQTCLYLLLIPMCVISLTDFNALAHHFLTHHSHFVMFSMPTYHLLVLSPYCFIYKCSENHFKVMKKLLQSTL